MTITELGGARIVLVFLSAKNNIVLVNWGVWGHATPGKVLYFLTAETVSGGF